MVESSDDFLGEFNHCTLCNPVVYGGHGQSLYWQCFVLCVCVTNYKYRLAVAGGRFGDSHTCDQKLEQEHCL